jgi:hypothetical protein
MKKLFAALAAVACVTAANSATLAFIDEFNGNQGPLTDTSINGESTLPPECDSVIGVRTLCTTLLAHGVASSNNSVTVGGGILNIQNGVGEDTEVILRWTLAAGFVPLNATGFSFLVVESERPTTLDFSFNGTSFASNTVPAATIGQEYFFNAPVTSLNAGGVLELRLNGPTGWDFALDSIGFAIPDQQVPVPAVPVLVGLGLLALGLSRKQK